LAQSGLDTDHVLAFDMPVMSYGKTPEQIGAFYREVIRRISELPGVDKVAVGTVVPWRDAGSFGPGLQFTTEGRTHGPEEEDPRAQFRAISPGFFASLGVPIIAGRDFNDADRKSGEQVVIISQSVALRMFPNQEAVNRHLQWTDPVIKFIPGFSDEPRRIIGVTTDLDDEHVIPGPQLTIYHPFEQLLFGSRHVHGPTGGARRDIDRCARGSAFFRPPELHCVWRVCAGGAGYCGCGSCGRAGVFGERANARVWDSAGDWFTAPEFAERRHRARHVDGRAWHRRGSGIWLCGHTAGEQIFSRPANAQRAASGDFGSCAADCRDYRFGAAGRARGAN
jgi:hypothetical protein